MYCRSRASERNVWMLEPFLGWVVDSVRAVVSHFTTTREVSENSKWHWLWPNKHVPTWLLADHGGPVR